VRWWLILALLVVGGCGGDRVSRLSGSVEKVAAAGAPGALVLVRDGEASWSAATGFADVDARRELRAGDRFRVGSVTKTFVATVVLQLVAEGRLGLDDPVAGVLPGLLPDGDRITIRHLLAHRSGLADIAADPAVLKGSRSDWSPRRLIALVSRQPRTSAPGGDFRYSSTNYLVLGLVVEHVTGRSLSFELARRIIQPLHLSDTELKSGRILGAHVHGYELPSHQGLVDPAGKLHDLDTRSARWAGASGDLVSTAEDVARFLGALLGGDLLPPAQLRSMETVRPLYGLGLAVYPTRCGRAWGHTGNVNGVVTIAWSTLGGRRQVVAMANAYPLPPAAEVALRRAAVAALCG
jgi:D-alanyl-D-alanine carboxypeptidase